jgi:hypothetical protein
MNIVLAYKTFICVCIVLAAISMYFSAQVILNDKRAACIASVLYTLSTYFGTDAFIRHANGEFQSFIFLPIAFAGLYDIIFGENKRWLLLPLGLCGILVTHTLTAVLTVLFFIIFALIFIKRLIERPKKFLYIFVSIIVFILLSASFLFPMLEQMQSNKFLATDGTSANKYGSLEYRSMQTIWSLFWVFNTYIKPRFIPQGFGFAFLLLIVLFICYHKKVKSPQAYSFFGLALFALIMTSCFFPWEYLQNIAGVLQFPWRIMLFAAFFIALFGGVIIQKIKDSNYLTVYILAAVLLSSVSVAATLLPNYGYVVYQEYTNTVKDYSDNYNIGINIGLGEYLPTGTDKTSIMYRGDFVDSSDSSVYYIASRENGDYILEFSGNNGNDTYFDLPFIMYKGYKATLKTNSGETNLPLTYGINNVLRVNIGSAEAGTIRIRYEGTEIQKVSFVVTVVSFCVVIAYYIIVYIKRRRRKPDVNAEGLML